MSTAETVAPGHEPTLKKAISRKLLLFFIIGDVLGAGIYALVGSVATETGGAIWIAFLASLVLAVITAFAYAELVTKYPKAAGAALYVNKAFRVPFVSFMVAFAVMCSGITSAATLSTAFGGDYLSAFVDIDGTLVGVLFILVVAAINLRGISESVKLNAVLTTIEVGGLVLVSVIAIAAITSGAEGTDPGRAFEFKEGTGVIAAMIGGAGLAFYALIGFEDSVNVAEEAQDPRRDYPFALFGGLIAAGVIYFVVTILASMTVPTGDLAKSDGALQLVASEGPLGVDSKVFSAIALFALANGALINMIMASRLLYGMSNEGVLPAVLGKVSPKTRTPWVAIGFTTALAAILIIVGNLDDLASMTVFLLLGVFTVVNVCVLVLRREDVGHSHFVAPTAIPIVGAIICLAFMVFNTDGDIALKALFLLAVGAILFVVTWFAGGRREMDTSVMEAIEHPEGRR
jgi:basic amino acid/polyamine antiporter, APA family